MLRRLLTLLLSLHLALAPALAQGAPSPSSSPPEAAEKRPTGRAALQNGQAALGSADDLRAIGQGIQAVIPNGTVQVAFGESL
ncbi:MAG: hypothetical protein AAF965_12570, partial [Pseudomonadota bacterium]